MSVAYDTAAIGSAVGGEARARVSWSAIFSGVVLAVSVQVLLSILGAGVGLGMVDPGHADSANASSLGIGAGIWWAISMVISLLAGGYAAARLAGVASRFDGVLHGLVVWGLGLLLTLYLLTSAVGGLLGGAFSVLGGTVSAAGSVIGGAASTVGQGIKAAAPALVDGAGSGTGVQGLVDGMLKGPTTADPASMSAADAAKAIGQAMPDLIAGGPKADAAKQRITAIVAAQTHVSPDQARQRVEDAQAQFDATRQKAVAAAKIAADRSAEAASRGSFFAFAGMLIGAIAAALGGAIASPRREVVALGGRRMP